MPPVGGGLNIRRPRRRPAYRLPSAAQQQRIALANRAAIVSGERAVPRIAKTQRLAGRVGTTRPQAVRIHQRHVAAVHRERVQRQRSIRAQQHYMANLGRAVEHVARLERGVVKAGLRSRAGGGFGLHPGRQYKYVVPSQIAGLTPAQLRQERSFYQLPARVQGKLARGAVRQATDYERAHYMSNLGRSVSSQAGLQRRVAEQLQRIGTPKHRSLGQSLLHVLTHPAESFAPSQAQQARTTVGYLRSQGKLGVTGRTGGQLRQEARVLSRPPKARAKALQRLQTATLEQRTQEASLAAPGAKALEQLARPIHGIAGGVLAAQKGQSIATGAGRGFALKDRATFSDVLAKAGVKNKLVRTVGGLVLDIALDPTTYLTLGEGAVAKAAAERMSIRIGKAATRAAKAAGHSDIEAKTIGRTLRDSAYQRALGKAAAKHHVGGLEIRFAGGRVPGVTRATAAARRGTGRVARPVTGSRQVVRARRAARGIGAAANAQIRGVDITRAEQKLVKGLQRETRAGSEANLRRAGERINALLGTLHPTEHEQIINAIEHGEVSKLKGLAKPLSAPRGRLVRGTRTRALRHDPDRLYRVAREVEGFLKGQRRIGRRSGILAGDIGRTARSREEVSLYHAGAGQTAPSTARVQNALTLARREQATARADVAKAATPRQLKGAQQRLETTQVRVRNLRHRLHGMRQRERQIAQAKTGLRASQAERAGRAAQGYFPRVRQQTLEQGGLPEQLAQDIASFEGRHEQIGTMRPQPGAVKRREYYQPRSALPAEQREPLATDIRQTLSSYAHGISRGSAAAELNTRIVGQLGRKLPRDVSPQQLADLNKAGQHVYRVRRGMLEKLDPIEDYAHIRRASQGRATQGGGQYAVIPEHLVSRVRQRQETLGADNPALRAFDRFQGGWKGLALGTPSYLVRNLLGDLFNAYGHERAWRLARNFVKGQKALSELGRYERALRNFDRQIPAEKRTIKLTDEQRFQIAKTTGQKPEEIGRHASAMQVALLAERMGVIRQGRFLELMQEGRKLTKARGSGAWRDAAKRVEDSTRMATFLGGLQRGLNPREAAQRASGIHFDYGDLTAFEKGVLRRAMPFYTFSARNIPLQAKLLLTRPGKLATVEKVREEGRKAAGLPRNWEQGVNPYEARQLGVPIRIGNKTVTVSVGSPFTDLNEPAALATGDPASPIRRVVDLTSLWPVKPLAEVVYNYSTFYRDQIQPSDRPETQAPKWAIEIATRGGPAGKAWARSVGLTPNFVDKTTGNRVWGWGRKTDYLFNNLAVGLAGQVARGPLGGQSQNARTMTPTQVLATNLGARSTTYDPKQVSLTKVFDEAKSVQDRLNVLNGRAHPTDRQPNGKPYPINAAHPTPEYTRLMQRQRELEGQKFALQQQTRPGGIVRGRVVGGGEQLNEAAQRRLRRANARVLNPSSMAAAEARAERAAARVR